MTLRTSFLIAILELHENISANNPKTTLGKYRIFAINFVSFINKMRQYRLNKEAHYCPKFTKRESRFPKIVIKETKQF